jgi:competence protein ComEC
MGALIAVTAGFASGVGLRSLFFISHWELAFLGVLALICSGAYVANRHPRYLLIGIAGMAGIVGVLRFELFHTEPPLTFIKDLHHRVAYDGVVVSEPRLSDSTERVPIRVSKDSESTVVLATIPRTQRVSPGDRVFVSGVLVLPEPFLTEQGRVFAYDEYLEGQGISFRIPYAYLSLNERAPGWQLSTLLSKTKRLFLDGLEAVLPEPYASLAAGMVIGGKSGLGKELESDFMESGLIQIVVLSGYNVTIIATWVLAGVGWLTRSRRWGSVVAALVLTLFVGCAGWGAPALRALLMALIALYARASSRTYVAGRALLVVTLGMLIENPLLIHDPGFVLSVLATMGVVWLTPLLEGRLRVVPAPVREALATTLGAQIAVTPYLAYSIGAVSLVGVVANVLAFPLVPLAMFSALVATLAGIWVVPLFPALGVFIALPAYVSTKGLIAIAEGSANLPYASLTLPPFPFWLVLATYAALFVASNRLSITDQSRLAKKASM